MATGDGMVAAKASTVGVEFSGGGTAPLVRMEQRAGRELSLSWPTVLPKPQLEGRWPHMRRCCPMWTRG